MATNLLNLSATPPTFGGHAQSVVVGGKTYGLPPDTAVSKIRSGDGRELLYVMLYDNSVHLLTNAGEIEIPSQLVESVKRRYFPQRAVAEQQEAGR